MRLTTLNLLVIFTLLPLCSAKTWPASVFTSVALRVNFAEGQSWRFIATGIRLPKHTPKPEPIPEPNLPGKPSNPTETPTGTEIDHKRPYPEVTLEPNPSPIDVEIIDNSTWEPFPELVDEERGTPTEKVDPPTGTGTASYPIDSRRVSLDRLLWGIEEKNEASDTGLLDTLHQRDSRDLDGTKDDL